MKILFASGYNPFLAGSGPGSCLYYLSKMLGTMGHEVHILAPKIEIEGDLGSNVFLHYYDNPLKNFSFGESWIPFSFFSIRQIKYLCEKCGVDIINGYSPTTFAYSMMNSSKLPFVVTAHGTSFGEIYSVYTTPKKYLDLSIIRDAALVQPMWVSLTSLEYTFADRVVAVSESVSDELINYYHLDRQKISVIRNGVVALPAKEEMEESLILSVGRMVWRKGFLYLINAMPSVLKEYPKAKLLLIGEGRYKQKLIEHTRNLNLEKSVTFLGYVQKEELFRLYAKAHVYVQPSLYEPLGNTILEAMISEKPVIASRVGGIPEIIRNRENGVLVDPCNSNQLAESIKLLLSDASYCKRLGKMARKTVEESFSWESIAKETLKMYQAAIDDINVSAK